MPAACPPRLGGRPRRRCTARAGSPRSRFWNDSSPATHVIATSWVILHISRNLPKVCVQCHRGPDFPEQSQGSLIVSDGKVVGSRLIGQSSKRPGDFHPRPSAAGGGYDALASGGTNLGPANPKLRDGASDDPATPTVDESFAGVRQLASEFRLENGLPTTFPVPIDAVTRSGSGLDPHISVANATLQIARVARERKLSQELVRQLVGEHTFGPQLGFLGSARVSVLELNLALDDLAVSSPSPASP